MNSNYYAVIMAGGKGERFWPLSRSHRPKQLLTLAGDRSLLAQSVERLKGLIADDHIYIITNADILEAVYQEVPHLPRENIIGEPVGRDTAAAIALGATIIQKRDNNAVFAVLTADHVIKDLDIFRNTIKDALDLAAKSDVLVTIGIQPTFPSTGMGYIESGNVHQQAARGTTFLKAVRFVEKPNQETAKSYIAQGNFYWNSGMFIWSARSIQKALNQCCSNLMQAMQVLTPAIGTARFAETLKKVYEPLTKISIDYAVMEKANNVIMAKGVFSWDDVGSWPALDNHFPADPAGNRVIGEAELLDSSDNIVVSQPRFTAMIGVSNLVVVQTEDVTLICPKDRAQDIKQLLQAVRKREKTELL